MTSRAEKRHESASAWSFSNLCLWLDFHRMLQAPWTGPKGVSLGVPVLAERLFLPAALHRLPQIHFIYRSTLFLYSFNYKKVVLLTECSDDVTWCTGRAGSIGVCCSDGKLIRGIWEKSLENHGFHLDLLSYYCPNAVKVWPSGSKKAKIIKN